LAHSTLRPVHNLMLAHSTLRPVHNLMLAHSTLRPVHNLMLALHSQTSEAAPAELCDVVGSGRRSPLSRRLRPPHAHSEAAPAELLPML